MGKADSGTCCSVPSMRAAICRNASTYAARALESSRTAQSCQQHRQETRRTDGTAFQPQRENPDLAASGVQCFGKVQQRTPIEFGKAGDHDRKAGHEKGWSAVSPALRLNVARRTQIEKPLFIYPVELRGEPPVLR